MVTFVRNKERTLEHLGIDFSAEEFQKHGPVVGFGASATLKKFALTATSAPYWDIDSAMATVSTGKKIRLFPIEGEKFYELEIVSEKVTKDSKGKTTTIKVYEKCTNFLTFKKGCDAVIAEVMNKCSEYIVVGSDGTEQPAGFCLGCDLAPVSLKLRPSTYMPHCVKSHPGFYFVRFLVQDKFQYCVSYQKLP